MVDTLLSESEENFLRFLIEGCSMCGYPKDELFADAAERGFSHPLYIIRSLAQKGFVRFDKASNIRREAVFKPSPQAYNYFESRDISTVRL